MLLNSVVSLFVGATILLGVDLACARYGDQRSACISTQGLYGITMALGASSVGLFAAFNTALAAAAMPARHPADESEILLVH